MKRLPINPILLSRLGLLLLLSIGASSYLVVEDLLFLRLAAVLLALVAAVFLLLRRRVAFPAMLTLYLASVALANWYFASSSALAAVLIGFVLVTLLTTMVLFYNEGLQLPLSSLLLVGLLGAEVFLLYAFFLIGPTAIGILLLCYVYVVWGVLLLARHQALSRASLSAYLVLAIVFTLLTLYSTQLHT